MNAKNKFREGWIMLLRPFSFAEISKPLQKMTVLYAYSEKPIIEYVLTPKGQEEKKFAFDEFDKPLSLTRNSIWRKNFREGETEYEIRFQRQLDYLYKTEGNQENYLGEMVQCLVEGEICKFYPEEYSIISRDTFDYLLTSDEHEYQIEIEDNSFFNLKDVKQKIFYTQTRGINKKKAMKMNSNEAKDAVIFRPQKAILDMFCREHEIY